MHPAEASEPRGSTRQRPLAEKYYPEPELQRNRKIFFLLPPTVRVVPGGWAEEKRKRSRQEKGRAAESCSSSSKQRLLCQQPGSCCHLLMRGGAEKVGITSAHMVSETVSKYLIAPATMFYSHFCFASAFKGFSPCPCSSFSSSLAGVAHPYQPLAVPGSVLRVQSSR